MATLDTGRPITKKGAKAAKKRKQAREWYQSLSDSEKKAYVRRRSRAAQRKADAKRLRKDRADRNEYHRTKTSPQHQAEKSGKMKQPKKCAVCGSTENVQFHHTGKEPLRGRYLCAKHNNRSKPTK
jgi:FKBP-type peptidyl-prolyl cis-trans isomerase